MTDSDGRAMVALDKMSNGHFEVRATFDGKPVQLMVDTGASSTVLTASDAARIGFDPASLTYSVPVMTANGAAQAARVTVGEIAIGGITRRNVPVLVANGNGLGQSLLGMNFIGTLSGFDIRGDRLVLRD
jgi:aspartyl protease family protein